MSYRGKNAEGSIARDARASRNPFAFSKPKALCPGLAYRRLKVAGPEAHEEATARAKTMSWWPAVTHKSPTRASSEWWVWVVRLDRIRVGCEP